MSPNLSPLSLNQSPLSLHPRSKKIRRRFTVKTQHSLRLVAHLNSLRLPPLPKKKKVTVDDMGSSVGSSSSISHGGFFLDEVLSSSSFSGLECSELMPLSFSPQHLATLSPQHPDSIPSVNGRREARRILPRRERRRRSANTREAVSALLRLDARNASGEDKGKKPQDAEDDKFLEATRTLRDLGLLSDTEFLRLVSRREDKKKPSG